jgi:hypothetical protein
VLTLVSEFADADFPFLSQYSLKVIGCFAGLTSQNPETYENESSSIAYRLCPNDVGCDNDYEYGCAEGFGDYVVGLKTFVTAFFEEQGDDESNDNYDDNFDVEEFVECSEYETEGDSEDEDDGNNGNYNYNQQPYNQNNDDGNFYVGPTCAADGINVALGLFTDEYCFTAASDVSFENLSNGYSLPFSDGGLVSTYCTSCLYSEDDDDGAEYEISEFCDDIYKHAASSCEVEMRYFSSDGQHNYACELITEVVPFYAKEEISEKKIGKTIFVIITVLALVGGLIGYVVWWRSKKAASSVVVDTTANREGTLA